MKKKGLIFNSYPSVANANLCSFVDERKFRSYNHVSTLRRTSTNDGAWLTLDYKIVVVFSIFEIHTWVMPVNWVQNLDRIGLINGRQYEWNLST